MIAVGGIEDRAHLLTGFPTTLAAFEIIKQVNGSYSNLITHEIKPRFFKNGKAAMEHLPLAMMRQTL